MKTEFFVKLVGPNAGFTGLMFGMSDFEFKDGVSVNPIHFIAAQRLAIEARGLVYLDSQGNEIGEVVAGAMPLAELDEQPVVTLRQEQEQVEGEVTLQGGTTDEEPVTFVIPSREELEAIADKKGIAGLREIGERLDVRAKNIPSLIEKILTKRG
jgi:hypothetical protein